MIDLTRELAAALAHPEGKAAIRDAVREALRAEREEQEETFMDVTEAAKLIGKSPAALRKMAERGTVPVARIGKRLSFRRADLLAARK